MIFQFNFSGNSNSRRSNDDRVREQRSSGPEVRRRHERQAAVKGDLSVLGHRQLREFKHGRTDQTLGFESFVRSLGQ